ncbi:hypothetical protein SAMN05421806_1134 [Streptomyces indicus]|uniref:Uncharacterized protein n=1 Tax=Streptomyces indicus TaxID=417292 RepID=A0A1G9FAE6_9ACTN|nr:hypothetical protein SAMN05421806_1134 [Streptomyces indicus]
MSVSHGIGWGSGGPRRSRWCHAPGKHSLNTTQEAGR